MFALSRLSIWAAVGGLVMLGGYSLPVRGEEPVQNLGPVGPNEAILTSVGTSASSPLRAGRRQLRPQRRDVG